MSALGVPTRGALERAWQKVWESDLADGTEAPGVTRFASEATQRLDALAASLTDGNYQPAPLTEIAIPKGDGEMRELRIPSVTDRVVERAVLEQVTPLVDPWLGPAAHAYRRGLGVVSAVRDVVLHREEGLRWVLRTDIDDCFPSIPTAVALDRFERVVRVPAVVDLVTRLVERPIGGGRGLVVATGLAQGTALAPMLTNLVLAEVDAVLLDAGFPIVRYADDMVVACESAGECAAARRLLERELGDLGMRLGEEDTYVTTFEEGFSFLGEDFGARYPPALAEEDRRTPDRRVVFVGLQGSRVRVRQGRLQVWTADDEERLDVPTGHVSRVVCFGSVGFSAGARSWALGSGVDVVFASRSGSYQGRLQASGGRHRDIERLRAQLRVHDDERLGLPVARSIVAAKAAHQVTLLRRFGRREHADLIGPAVQAIQRFEGMLPDCASLDEVRGMEGAAASAYFEAYGQMFPEDVRFQTRSRRPPMDVANAGLSYLYAILLGECETALHAVGLDPRIGVLHSGEKKRPSLALDLMEEFRVLVVDQVTLAFARKGRMTAASGTPGPDGKGVYLGKGTKTALVDAYERRMLQETNGALPDFAGVLRRHVYRQAQRLAKSIADPAVPWTGLSWR